MGMEKQIPISDELQEEMADLQYMMDTAIRKAKKKKTQKRKAKTGGRGLEGIPIVVQDAIDTEGAEGTIKFMLKWDTIKDPLDAPWILQYRLAYQTTTQDEYDAIAGLDKPFEDIRISELQLQKFNKKAWCDYSDDEEKSLAYKQYTKAMAKKKYVAKWVVYGPKPKPITELIINHLMPDKITENEVVVLRKMANMDNLEDLLDCDQTIILDVFSRAGFEDNPGVPKQ